MLQIATQLLIQRLSCNIAKAIAGIAGVICNLPIVNSLIFQLLVIVYNDAYTTV